MKRSEQTAPRARGRGPARSEPCTALVRRDRWYETLAWAMAELGFEHLANPHSLRAARQRGQKTHRVASGAGFRAFWDRNQNFFGAAVGSFLVSMFRIGSSVDVTFKDDDDQDDGRVFH